MKVSLLNLDDKRLPHHWQDASKPQLPCSIVTELRAHGLQWKDCFPASFEARSMYYVTKFLSTATEQKWRVSLACHLLKRYVPVITLLPFIWARNDDNGPPLETWIRNGRIPISLGVWMISRMLTECDRTNHYFVWVIIIWFSLLQQVHLYLSKYNLYDTWSPMN